MNYPSIEEQRYALRVFWYVWTRPAEITPPAAKFLEERSVPGETLLDTCCRLAGVPATEVRPFDFAHNSALAARVQIAPR